MRIEITCPIHPTEDPERVRKAVETIFPASDIKLAETELTAAATALSHFAERLRDQQIRDTARSVMLRGLKDLPGEGAARAVKFWLNKQAALMDRVNFTDSPSVLGDIRVVIETDEPETLIDELAPRKPEDAE